MTAMDITEILEYLPHRYPFLLIDRVIDLEPGKTLTGLKNVSFNEPYFLGHFPQKPIMPGVLIIEALAQATGILAFKSEAEKPDKNAMYYLVGVDKGFGEGLNGWSVGCFARFQMVGIGFLDTGKIGLTLTLVLEKFRGKLSICQHLLLPLSSFLIGAIIFRRRCLLLDLGCGCHVLIGCCLGW